ncbi:type II toxin-antitoxin system VapC family toxin [Methylobacterium sp. WL8]|uniref:type II toxin-antitoxin system VapC family toxin n=1 Tax=Methylobacterium sp. WL8 TaxID=2603899 RepID=UPI0011C9E90C|nr:type II toxin-antitoxin system VapC family toxin [Methylobacterium sp. WL8]TXN81100.1 type II toxin-antitoxin system VapC family toxin [Methylobacterium sp. WL8]
MTEIVLDASAVLAVIFDEAGAERVASHLPGAMISTVNVSEVMTKLYDLGMPQATVEDIVAGLQLTILPFDLEQAAEAARLRSHTREAGLSLGDRACLATAKHQGVPALTSDRAWKSLKRAVSVKIELIR